MAERAVALSASDGCIVLVDETTTANVRWANNTLTTNGVARDRSITCIAIAGGAVGALTRSTATLGSLEDFVAAADAAARDNRPAEDAQPLIEHGPASGDWDAPPAETSIGVFDRFAPALGETLAQARGDKRLLFGYAEHEMQTTYLASSSGLRLRHDQPTGHVEINAKSPDFSRSAWAGAPTATFDDIDLGAIDAELVRRLGWAARQVELPPGRYETLLPPSAVADLMIDLYWAAGGRDAHDGMTVFSRAGGGTRIGERLTEVPITLRSDPAAAGLECEPFVIAHGSSSMSSVFDNGLGLAPTPLIADGALASLVQTRHSAGLTGLPVTPAIDNLIMEGPPGGRDLDAMVSGSERALLLTCLWYIREVDPQTLLLTGLTRDGVYLVEGGEVVGAVNNFRFNESPVGLLGRIAEVGATQRCLPREMADYFTRTAMPALRVADFNMSSISRAA
ncbi:MAG: metallopeptidase TldD-related protein [Acidimicrobiales bacterium]